MAGSFMARLRERMEQLQQEMQPEAGFDRRAYGYGDDAGAEDATFEEVEREEESPWRRPGSGEPPAAPAASAPDAGLEESPWRAVTESAPPPAPPRPVTRAARAEAFDPFGVRDRQSGGGARRAAPSPPSREAPSRAPGRTPASPTASARSTPRDPERKLPRGASRSRRLRARLRQPDSLRDLFLLREVIDRPIALRRPRPRGR